MKFDSPLFLLEMFAGCWRLTRAAIEVGYSCVPSIDILPAFGGSHVFDILTSAGRQVVWALIVVLKPMWVHCGYPCTFWSSLAHCTRTRSEVNNERTRLQELDFIVFKAGCNMAKECWPPCGHREPAEMSFLEVGCSVGSHLLVSIRMR